MNCKLCSRQLASEPSEDQEPICRICAEEVLRILYALMNRGSMSILAFLGAAIIKKGSVTSDEEFVTALTDYVEFLKGHFVPCSKCNPRRWAKDIL
jgi:hypothetical protein